MEVGAEEVPDSERCKGSIRSRFLTLRFNEVVKKSKHVQRGHITIYGLTSLLKFPDHLIFPIPVTQWIVDHSPSGGYFKHKSKVINFHKEMVSIIFGLPSGISLLYWRVMIQLLLCFYYIFLL